MDYKKILEGVVNIINTTKKSDIGFVNICSYICENCPELKESEDEKIRKALIDGFTVMKESKNCGKTFSNHNIPVADILAWLEKQGEKESFDKVEPKFYEGEWLCVNKPNDYARLVKIIKVVDVFGKERYKISRDYDSDLDVAECDFIEKNYHLWTIEDAKDGDVLVIENRPFIYNGKVNPLSVGGYCGITIDGLLKINEELPGYGSKGWTMFDTDIYPATKEQRDLLFQKMKEASYVWDADEKKLKKVDTYCQNCKGFLETGNCFVDWDCIAKQEYIKQSLKDSNLRLIEQKPAEWSEEDEKTWKELIEEVKDQLNCVPAPDCRDKEDEKALKQLNRWLTWLKSLKDRVQPKQEWSEEDEIKIKSIIAFLKSPSLCAMDGNKGIIDANIKYLKSLKDRVQLQPKQEWSEEDNRICKAIIDNIQAICEEGYFVGNIDKDVLIDWLKAFRPQKQWKPSEEQMNALDDVISSRDIKYDVLSELWTDLNKLREE